MAEYADCVAPKKWSLLPRLPEPQRPDAGIPLGLPSKHPLVDSAHEVGLCVHAWVFKDEPSSFDTVRFATLEEEVTAFLGLDIDGLFTDFPGEVQAAMMAVDPELQRYVSVNASVVPPLQDRIWLGTRVSGPRRAWPGQVEAARLARPAHSVTDGPIMPPRPVARLPNGAAPPMSMFHQLYALTGLFSVLVVLRLARLGWSGSQSSRF